jgi:hypothetical protein
MFIIYFHPTPVLECFIVSANFYQSCYPVLSCNRHIKSIYVSVMPKKTGHNRGFMQVACAIIYARYFFYVFQALNFISLFIILLFKLFTKEGQQVTACIKIGLAPDPCRAPPLVSFFSLAICLFVF